MMTAWGYDVNSALPPLLTAEEYARITGAEESERLEAALNAASQAIRNYCGWHVSPSVNCTANPAGGAIIAKLPAGYVSALTSITENGEALSSSDYEWRKDGLIKRAAPYAWSDKWGGIEVQYTAGYDSAAVPDLIETACAIVAGVLAVAPGVTSESADGVSISYSANAASIAAALTSQQKNALEVYKLRSSHAA